jgi:hypothetical protein
VLNAVTVHHTVALGGLKFLDFNYGFSAFTVSYDSLEISFIDSLGSTVYSASISPRPDQGFSGVRNDILIPSIVAIMLGSLCLFCVFWRCCSMKKQIAQPLREWRDRILENDLVPNNTRGVFEVLSDSDDEGDDDNVLLERYEDANDEVEIKFSRV